MVLRAFFTACLLLVVACVSMPSALIKPPLVYCIQEEAEQRDVSIKAPDRADKLSVVSIASNAALDTESSRKGNNVDTALVSSLDLGSIDSEFVLSWPLNTMAINSLFGTRMDPLNGKQRFHGGLDLDGLYGTLVLAAAEGVVVLADWRGGHGRAMVIRHQDGYETRYSHLAEHVVRKGMRVRRGQAIAYLGNSGRSTGPHLHFEVWKGGKIQDPLEHLSPAGIRDVP